MFARVFFEFALRAGRVRRGGGRFLGSVRTAASTGTQRLQRAPWAVLSFTLHGILLLLFLIQFLKPAKKEIHGIVDLVVETPDAAIAPPPALFPTDPSETPMDDPKPAPAFEAPTIQESTPEVVEPMAPQDIPIEDFMGLNASVGDWDVGPLTLPKGFGMKPEESPRLAPLVGQHKTPTKTVQSDDRLFAHRTGDAKRRALRGNGGTESSESAVAAGLAWLASAQERSGGYNAMKYFCRAPSYFIASAQERSGGYNAMKYEGARQKYIDVADTGLALLAFLGAGHTASEGAYAGNVRRAVAYLESQQNELGRMSINNYAHGICTLALSEAYAVGAARKSTAQKAVDWMASQQTRYGGWTYDHQDGGDRSDTSITGWQVMAAKSAMAAGLSVKKDLFAKARKHFASVGAGGSGQTAEVKYVVRGGTVDKTSTSATLAIGMTSLLYMGHGPEEPWMEKAAKQLTFDGPRVKDVYQLYYANLAMFQIGGDRWTRWNKNFQKPLIDLQVSSGAMRGSWDPDKWGRQWGGRVYTTAMAVMCLEVYYRYLPIYR